MFKSIGKRLVADLEAVSIGDTDTDVQGAAGEAAFRDWLGRQLPTRFAPVSGAVLSKNHPPTTQRDCLVFDRTECPVFRQIGGQPDLYPIEGVVGCIEINTGKSGATSEKLLHDCRKLSEIGGLARDSNPLLSKVVRLTPLQIPGNNTISSELYVGQQQHLLPPILYLFAERVRASLKDLAESIASHNKSVAVSAGVSGAFVLETGVILHIAPNEGWNHARLTGMNLAYMNAEPWEVLLKMVSIVWNHLWKGPYLSPDLGPYYADKAYFLEQEMPRIVVLSDADYLAQTESGFVTIKGG